MPKSCNVEQNTLLTFEKSFKSFREGNYPLFFAVDKLLFLFSLRRGH